MKKIMMVDDEKDQIFSLKIAIEETYGKKYQIITANSGMECLELLKKNENPDIILLDIMMPEMSGWELFDRIKDNPSWENIPVVFLTARTDRVAEDAGQFLGDGFIEKPVKTDDLINMVEKTLNKNKQENNNIKYF